MIKKALLFALMAATTFCKTPAQSKKTFAATHTVYAEGSTQGPVYSLNYDKIFSQGRIFAKSFRAGFSVYNDVLAVPAGLNFISGKSAHHAELDFRLGRNARVHQSALVENGLIGGCRHCAHGELLDRWARRTGVRMFV